MDVQQVSDSLKLFCDGDAGQPQDEIYFSAHGKLFRFVKAYKDGVNIDGEERTVVLVNLEEINES